MILHEYILQNEHHQHLYTNSDSSCNDERNGSSSHSPCLLDLVEIEKKLREAKAERERLLRERVSHLPWEALAGTSNHPQHSALDTAVWLLTPTQLTHDGPRKQQADVLMFVMHVCSIWEMP